jgi:hypothetical protein
MQADKKMPCRATVARCRRDVFRRNRNVTRGTRIEPYRKMTGLEIAKRTVRSSDSLRPDKDRNLWRGRPPPKQKKRLEAEEELVTQKHRPPHRE